jgi:hypothetical protein
MNNRLAYIIFCSVIGCASLGRAQDLPIQISAPPFQTQQPAVTIMHGSGGKEMGFQFVSAEPALSTSAVKGAPYSLEATVDTEQTLADGNRIVHHQVVRVYRDADGRTRREETLAALGPWAASGTPPTIVTINDPVSGATYSLDPQNKIATKLPAGLPAKLRTFGPHGGEGAIAISASPKPIGGVAAFDGAEGGEGGVVVVQNGMAAPTEKWEDASESLGKQTIAGVSADGTRLSTTIPAEAMGNERPIEITRERWFSPELQIILRSKQSDPRFGVTNYEVTKLDRTNPAHSLFEVPRDYQIRNAPEPPLPTAPPK